MEPPEGSKPQDPTQCAVNRQLEDALMGSCSCTQNSEPSEFWRNPRKRPHSYGHTASSILGDDVHISHGDHDVMSSYENKRVRGADWPLKSTNGFEKHVHATQRREKNPPKPSHCYQASISLRSSKFQEGSMNNKTSRKPPSLFTKEEDAMERHSKSQEAEQQNIDMEWDAGIEPSKPSGIFRFGKGVKAIANAFNPVTVWQGINGKWKEKGEQPLPEMPEMDERQVRAAKAYAELKKNGFKGAHIVNSQRHSYGVPAGRYEDEKNELGDPDNLGKMAVRKITSDVSKTLGAESHGAVTTRGAAETGAQAVEAHIYGVGSKRSSFRDSAIDVGEYPHSSDHKHSVSKTSTNLVVPPQNPASGRRSVSPFSEASTGRTSSLHLLKPSLQGLKKNSSHIQLPSIKPNSTTKVPSTDADFPNRSIPLVQGLRREQSKKDIAKQYKLSKKVSDLESKLENARRDLELAMHNAPPAPKLLSHSGRKPFKPGALPSLPSERNMTSYIMGATDSQTMPATPPIPHEAFIQPNSNKKSNSLKIQQSAPQLREETRNLDAVDNHSPPAAKTSQPKDFCEAPRQIPLLCTGNVPPIPATVKIFEDVHTIKHSLPGAKKRQAKVPSKVPHNSPERNTENVPPIPADIKVLWDTQNTNTNLDKTTNHSSVAHANRPESPFLGRPSVSPVRTRSKTQKRGVSHPPPNLASAKMLRVNKPLPSIQKEDFEWGDDVF